MTLGDPIAFAAFNAQREAVGMKPLSPEEFVQLAAGGLKTDTDKPRMGLLPMRALLEISKVLTFGARKYKPDNWKHVPDAQERYFSALLRHLAAWRDGEALDPESGLPHLAHAGCCLLFLIWFETHSM